MKPHLPLLAVCALLLAACVSPLPLGVRATPSLTPGPSPDYGRGESTPTPTLIPTPSVTPTPSLPPEALTRLAGREWRIEGDKVVAGKAVWYTLSPQGEWQPAQFVADFDSFQFSLEGLEIADEDGVVRIYDPNASDEASRLVYEDGKVNILFAVERAKLNCEPTDFKPVVKGYHNYWLEAKDEVTRNAFIEYFEKIVIDSKIYTDDFNVYTRVVIDLDNYCWGWIHDKLGIFFYRTIDGNVITIPLMEKWFSTWMTE